MIKIILKQKWKLFYTQYKNSYIILYDIRVIRYFVFKSFFNKLFISKNKILEISIHREI